METANTQSLAGALSRAGASETDLLRVFRNFNANAPAFREQSAKHEQ
jgi:hypothetical protein